MRMTHPVVRLVVAASAIALGATPAAAGQDQAATDGRWTASRTPDGQPDIQGIWTNDTLTPFERPNRLAQKAFYTEEEAIELERSAVEQRELDVAPGRTETVRLPPGSRFAGYNSSIWSAVRTPPRYQTNVDRGRSPQWTGSAEAGAEGRVATTCSHAGPIRTRT